MEANSSTSVRHRPHLERAHVASRGGGGIIRCQVLGGGSWTPQDRRQVLGGGSCPLPLRSKPPAAGEKKSRGSLFSQRCRTAVGAAPRR